MKTLIISTSLNPTSKGSALCGEVYKTLTAAAHPGHSIELVNLAEHMPLPHVNEPLTPALTQLKERCARADNFILGTPIYNYNVGDAFASFVNTCMPKADPESGKYGLYGLVVAAGGDMSYLASTNAHQMLMTHNRMLPLPRILYGGASYGGETGDALDADLAARVQQFCTDFYTLGSKLLPA